MQFIAHKLQKLKFGWNERSLTEDDFTALCRRFRISVTEMPLATDGFYYRVKGRDFIAINSRLKGARRLFVMYHELGHFLLHVPDTGATANFHGVGRRTRKEREADIFAICALIPKTKLLDREADPSDDAFAADLLTKRMRILKERGV